MKIQISLSADLPSSVSTIKEAMSLFRKIGISGFKVPKLSKESNVRAVTLYGGTSGKTVYWLFMQEGATKVSFWLSKPVALGKYNKILAKTSNIKTFLGAFKATGAGTKYRAAIDQLLA